MTDEQIVIQLRGQAIHHPEATRFAIEERERAARERGDQEAATRWAWLRDQVFPDREGV